jgi:hypothetical protein
LMLLLILGAPGAATAGATAAVTTADSSCPLLMPS